jgi:hypothetical protein
MELIIALIIIVALGGIVLFKKRGGTLPKFKDSVFGGGKPSESGDQQLK